MSEKFNELMGIIKGLGGILETLGYEPSGPDESADVFVIWLADKVKEMKTELANREVEVDTLRKQLDSFLDHEEHKARESWARILTMQTESSALFVDVTITEAIRAVLHGSMSAEKRLRGLHSVIDAWWKWADDDSVTMWRERNGLAICPSLRVDFGTKAEITEVAPLPLGGMKYVDEDDGQCTMADCPSNTAKNPGE